VAAEEVPSAKEDLALRALVEAGVLNEAEAARLRSHSRKTGQPLSDIVLPEVTERLDVDRRVKVDETEKTVGEFLVESEWITSDQLEEIRRAQSESDKTLGKILVEQGIISKEQLETAVKEQKKTGNPFWRTLINLRLALPKQISDAMRTEIRFPVFRKGDEKLASILREKGALSEEQLNAALQKSRSSRKNLHTVLLEEKMLSEDQLTDALAQQYNLPVVDLTKQPIQAEAVRMFPDSFIVENQALPIEKTQKALIVAFSDPLKIGVIEDAGILTGLELKAVLATPSQLKTAIEGNVGISAAAGAVTGEEVSVPAGSGTGPFTPSVSIVIDGTPLSDMVGRVSAIDLVNAMVEGAIRARATDIHLDPQEEGLRVRYRIDGMLHDVMAIPPSLTSSIITRLKVMAVMDIVDRRHPQDGHINMQVMGRTQDMRVATIPTALGEKMTIRLLSESQVLTGLNQLGLEPEQLKLLNKLIHKPYGMILAVGPVGSGKTTTLYSSLNRVNILTSNVMTIEDPVEYRLRGTNQVQVDHKINLGFAEGLRAILRQDPNIIMVGEIRDADTAKIAVRAALTGTLVFSTMHSNEASAAVSTLYNYGIPGFLVATALIGVIAQRLLRKICPECKEEYKPDKELLKQMAVRESDPDSVRFYRGKRCPHCFQTGYIGRTGIFEIMYVDEVLQDLIFRQTTKEVIRQVALDMGMQTLKESAYHKVKEGITTAEEYFRVVFV